MEGLCNLIDYFFSILVLLVQFSLFCSSYFAFELFRVRVLSRSSYGDENEVRNPDLMSKGFFSE